MDGKWPGITLHREGRDAASSGVQHPDQPSIMQKTEYLGIAPLHVTQSHLGVDGVPTGDAKDLQVRVLTVPLVALGEMGREGKMEGEPKHLRSQPHLIKGPRLLLPSQRTHMFGLPGPPALTLQPPLPPHPHLSWARDPGVQAYTHLLILLDSLLLSPSNDSLQLMEAALHILQPQPGALLLPPDALQQLLAVLLSHAWALLPLLDALRQDLIDSAEGEGAGGSIRSWTLG